MKESELRKHATCTVCRKRIGHTGVPLFWRVTVERFGIDANAARRQQGLGLMLGAELAMIMGPDEDMAQPMFPPAVATLCEDCATSLDPPPVAHLVELVATAPKS